MQTTISTPVSCYGIGVHSGRTTQLTLRPAPADSGIKFVRTDVSGLDNVIQATYEKVFDTAMSTSIRNDAKVHISTIEHLMAAIWGCSVDNLLIEVDGPEVPIMDGSSKPFVFLIECAGVVQLDAPRRKLKLLREISVTDNGTEIHAKPSDKTKIDLTIDFDSPAIGKQHLIFQESESFNETIADSRTFGFVKDLDYLLERGLAKGASLDNTIGIDKDVILNHDGLRHEDEFVRHKMLDLLGDLYSAGGVFIGEIKGHRTSHHLNNLFLRELFSRDDNYRWE